MAIEFPNVNNPFFTSAEPLTRTLEANLRNAAAALGSTGGGAPPSSAGDLFKGVQAAVSALGDVLGKGQNVNSALAGLANALADFTKALSPGGGGGPIFSNPSMTFVAPAPPVGIAPPHPSGGPNQSFIELPVGAPRGGMPPQPPLRPEPPAGTLYDPSARAPDFWTI